MLQVLSKNRSPSEISNPTNGKLDGEIKSHKVQNAAPAHKFHKRQFVDCSVPFYK